MAFLFNLAAAVVLQCIFISLGAPQRTIQPTNASLTTVTSWTALKSHGNSTLYKANIAEDPYPSDQPLYLLDLHGSYYDRGEAYGILVGKQSVDDYNFLLQSVFPKQWMIDVVQIFLAWQWDAFLSKQVPQEYIQELEGIEAGGRHIGEFRLRRFMEYGLSLANFPDSEVLNIFTLLVDELKDSTDAQKREEAQFLEANVGESNFRFVMSKALRELKIHCSMAGAWSNRTINGKLFTFRNLDWIPNTGINANKMITVFHNTTSDTYSHATIGFAGFLGALTGLGAGGITAHEAGLNMRRETFEGFTWSLRLRYVMEHASTLEQVMTIWNSTNNTVGLNHGFGSAKDGEFIALETMANYTAEFHANDPRESNYYVTSPQGQTLKMGFPMPQALWRTNHVYDPVMVSENETPPKSYESDSEKRYLIIHDALLDYELRKKKIDVYDFINVTSLAGIKGPNFYSCADVAGGTDVLSVILDDNIFYSTIRAVYDPATFQIHMAFEEGGVNTNSSWKPAVCGTYVHIDMRPWLT